MPRPVRALLPYAALVLLAWAVAADRPTAPGTVHHRLAAATAAPVAVAAGRTLRLPSAERCVRGGRLVLRFVSPSITGIATLRIAADGREAVRLDGVFLAGRAALRLGRGRTRVEVTGRTVAGNRVSAERTYRRCDGSGRPRPGGPRPVIIFEGGGED